MNASKLHERLAGVAPIDSVSIGVKTDKATWRVDFRPAATAQQRADAQAVIDAWTDADWDGTSAERRLARMDKIVTLRTRRGVLVYLRDYWQTQGNAGKVAAFNAMIAEIDAAVDALLPQT